jgi:hypothetical protein
MAAKPELPSALDELEQPRPRSDLKAKVPPRETVSDIAIEQNSHAIEERGGMRTRAYLNRSPTHRWAKCASTCRSM